MPSRQQIRTQNNKLVSDFTLEPFHNNKYVYFQIIHSAKGEIGIAFSCGHIDYWPNGGNHQPGCNNNSGCDHGRAIDYWVESLKSSKFVAHKCDSWASYEAGKCKSNPSAIMGTLTVDTK